MRLFNRQGMTLVELMCVVAIIALLFGIMAYFVIGNRQNNAQINMTNDIVSLINTQRSRAMGLNVAAYIRITDQSIEPRLGEVSACSTDITDQLPIHYTSDDASLNVGIDFAAGASHRTLDSIESNQYYNDTTSYVNVAVSVLTIDGTNINTNLGTAPKTSINPLVICFQPNGLVYFMNDNAFLDHGYARIDVTATNTPNPRAQVITLSTLGAINRFNDSF